MIARCWTIVDPLSSHCGASSPLYLNNIGRYREHLYRPVRVDVYIYIDKRCLSVGGKSSTEKVAQGQPQLCVCSGPGEKGNCRQRGNRVKTQSVFRS